MKYCFILIFTLLWMSSSFAQDERSAKEVLGFACYSGGVPTAPVERVSKLLDQKDYYSLSKLLSSENSAERYLAVIIIEKLGSLEKYRLTEANRILIRKIKKSSKVVSICSGCTFFEEVKLRNMFKPEYQLLADYWLSQYLILK